MAVSTPFSLACLVLLLASLAHAQNAAVSEATAKATLAKCIAEHAPKSKNVLHAHFHHYICASNGEVYYNLKVAQCVDAKLHAVSKCFVFKNEKHCHDVCQKKVHAVAN